VWGPMRIGAFFRDVLKAKLVNTVWSWGALQSNTGRVFLRVWKDEIVSLKGDQFVYVLDNRTQKSHRPGWVERARHVGQLRGGATGFGVVCVKRAKRDANGSIASFDETQLLRLGELIEDSGKIYARIEELVEVADLDGSTTDSNWLVSDLEALFSSDLDSTTREALIDARVGQGAFRARVLELWGSKCCVTGVITPEAIRASHIKPWRESDNRERLDAHNGLPLVATLDALFDAGLISFDDDGELLLSKTLSDRECERLSLRQRKLAKPPSATMDTYLAWHRAKRFK
jgi:putative restriction endonuclease